MGPGGNIAARIEHCDSVQSMQAAKVASGPAGVDTPQHHSAAAPVQDTPAEVPSLAPLPAAATTPGTTPAAPMAAAAPAGDNRYLQAAPAVPLVATGPAPAHTSKPSSSPGAPAMLIRPPKQITGASPQGVRNGADSFGHAEPSPTPDTPKSPNSHPGLEQQVNGLVEALAAQAEVVARFTTLVEHARAVQSTDQEQLYVNMGSTQVGVFTTLQQQVQKALGGLREQLAGASDIALSVAERWGQVNSTGKANLARWERVVSPVAAHGGTAAAAVPARHAAGQVRTHDACEVSTEDSEVPVPVEWTLSENSVMCVSSCEARLSEHRTASLPAPVCSQGACDDTPGRRILRRALGRVVHSRPSV